MSLTFAKWLNDLVLVVEYVPDNQPQDFSMTETMQHHTCHNNKKKLL